MKTLVIHPKDPTTDFLKVIYEGLDCEVITEHIGKRNLKLAINDHDRIIMLGHGTERGLMDQQFNSYIDSRLVYLLREKDCVCIWCNADKFVQKYALNGFYTGMIISDDMEANMYCVNATYDEIETSNLEFANAVKESIHLQPKQMQESVIKLYNSDNPIVEFNIQNIHSYSK